MEVDKKILERLKKGDESAFESLFWQYNSHIYNFVLSILYDKSLAEDITQTVFLKIWETHERILNKASMLTFLRLPDIWFIRKQRKN